MNGWRQSLGRVAVLVTLLAACGPPIGATSTDPPTPEPTEAHAAEPSAPIPAASPEPSDVPVDLIGSLEGAHEGDIACVWLVDADDVHWSIDWKAGHRLRWEDDLPILASGSDVIARSGDRIGIRGYGGWFVDRQLTIRFKVGALDPVAADRGMTRPRASVVDEWAPPNGLERVPSVYQTDWWRMAIRDDTADRAKAEEISRLKEVRTATQILLGSYADPSLYPCGEDRSRFTAESIAFVEPAPP